MDVDGDDLMTAHLSLAQKKPIEEGGAPELLQELARLYLGPQVNFPPMDDPPPGVRLRIRLERVSGVGPWAGRAHA